MLRRSFKAVDRDISRRGTFATRSASGGSERAHDPRPENVEKPLPSEASFYTRAAQTISVASETGRGAEKDYREERSSPLSLDFRFPS